MKPDSSSQSGENPASPKPDAEKVPHTSLVSEKDLWDFDDDPEEPLKKPEAGSEAAVEAGPEEKSIENAENQEAPAPITVVPRGPRRDSMPFKQTPPAKKPKAPEVPTELPETPEPVAESPSPEKRPRKSRNAELKPTENTFEELEPTAKDEPSQPSAENEAETPAPAKTSPTEPETITAKGLSKIEKIGLLSFLVLILAGGLFFVAHSISKLPENQIALKESDFPIKGAKVQTLAFKSYWRDPVVTGDNADTVRRGTIILPVVELKVSGGPAAVRIFFRNSDGDTIGDAVSRPVNGEGTLVLPATAGFEEPGMYAAYRTGETKSWKVEVFEGPSADAAGSEFKKLFEIPISTNRR